MLVMMKRISVADSGRGWIKLLPVKGAASMAALMIQFVTSDGGIVNTLRKMKFTAIMLLRIVTFNESNVTRCDALLVDVTPRLG